MDKRRSDGASPTDLRDILTEKQLCALQRISAFGWKLRFVRKPLSQCPIPFVCSENTNTFAILDGDGELFRQPHIQVRAANDLHTAGKVSESGAPPSQGR